MRLTAAVLAWAMFVLSTAGAFLAARTVSGTGRRGFEYMPDMAHSLPYNSFAPNPVTRDGKTLQAPVAGTIPRGFQPLRYRATPEEALRAGRELHNPVPPAPKRWSRAGSSIRRSASCVTVSREPETARWSRGFRIHPRTRRNGSGRCHPVKSCT